MCGGSCCGETLRGLKNGGLARKSLEKDAQERVSMVGNGRLRDLKLLMLVLHMSL